MFFRVLRVVMPVLALMGLVLYAVTGFLMMDWYETAVGERPWYWWGPTVGGALFIVSPVVWLICDQVIIRRAGVRDRLGLNRRWRSAH